jgi:transposase
MFKLDFTTEQIQALKYERFHHPHPRVRRKMEALLLKSQNLPHLLICPLVGVAANTLRNYFREFQNGGVEALQELDFYRPTSQLDAHQKSLAEHFRAFPVASIAQAQAEIEKLTGLKRSRTQIRLALLKLGLTCRTRRFHSGESRPRANKPPFSVMNFNHVLPKPVRGRAKFFSRCRAFCLSSVFGLAVVGCENLYLCPRRSATLQCFRCH